VQHEYGIFAEKRAGHLLAMLRELRHAIVTTLHTILGTPNLHQRRVMDEIFRLATLGVTYAETVADASSRTTGRRRRRSRPSRRRW